MYTKQFLPGRGKARGRKLEAEARAISHKIREQCLYEIRIIATAYMCIVQTIIVVIINYWYF